MIADRGAAQTGVDTSLIIVIVHNNSFKARKLPKKTCPQCPLSRPEMPPEMPPVTAEALSPFCQA